MNKRKIIAVLSAIALTAGLFTGCSGSAASSPTSSGSAGSGAPQILRVAIDSDISDLGPYAASSNGRNEVILSIYETLAAYGEVGGPLKNVIMKDYKTTDNVTYDIDIYDTVYDTNGNHITADDVVFSFQKAIQKANNSNVKYIKSIIKTGDYSVKLVLQNCSFVGCFGIVLSAVPIVSQKAYETSKDEMATDPVATGPYKVTNFVSGSSLKTVKSDNYWQKDTSALGPYATGNINEIDYTTIKEATQMSIALETGAQDIAEGMTATEAERFMKGGEKANAGFTVFQQTTNIGNQIYFSGASNSPFSNNLDLRQAICYAIDKQGLIKGALDGYGIPEYTFGGETFPDFDKSWKKQDYYNYNLTKAKQLFSSSGFNPSSKTLKIMSTNGAQQQKTDQILQGYLSQLGLKIEIDAYDTALYNSYMNDPTKWDILLNNTGASDYLVSVWRSKFDANAYPKLKGTCNGFQDPDLQSLLEKAISISGHTQADVDAFHNYFKQQAYGLGLYNNTVFTVGKNNIKGIVYDAKCFDYIPGTKF